MKELENVNNNIKDCKDSIKRFLNFKKWYKPWDYFIYNNRQIEDWINSYKYLLRLNIILKRAILKKYK